MSKVETASILKNRPNLPAIAPLDPSVKRPFWSVMIPTFNCANLLKQTLNSVLDQFPEDEEMEIEVVDDCSTKDDPEEVVRNFGRGKVVFYRQPRNVGPTENFNTCIRRSKGKWVQILHGDDYLLPGYYSAIRYAIQKYPMTGMVTSRVFFVDEKGEIEYLSNRFPKMETYTKDPLPFWEGSPFQFAGIVFSRDAVEHVGGFDPKLIHTADLDLWIRIIQTFGAVSVNQPLACYRVFEGNDTSKLKQTGENLRDYLRLKPILEASIPGFPGDKYLSMVSYVALGQAKLFKSLGNIQAEKANLQIWNETAPFFARLKLSLRNLLGR